MDGEVIGSFYEAHICMLLISVDDLIICLFIVDTGNIGS